MQIAGPYTVTVGAYPDTGVSFDTSVLGGLIMAIGVKYNVDSTIDLIVSTKGNNGPAQDVLTLAGASTDGWFSPVAPINGQDGSVISDQYNLGIPIYDTLTLELANGAGGDSVQITFLLL